MASQLADGASLPWTRWLFSGIGAGHRFGDLTLPEVSRGEIWRLVTCTFVHYSILHIGLNLLAMYQLGTLVESWYGSPQFVFIYGVIAGFGNLIAVLVRSYNGWGPRVHSGGGSVVILGLVGLCAIVGWRLRARMGPLLYRQMVGVLIVTALLGDCAAAIHRQLGTCRRRACGLLYSGLAMRRFFAGSRSPGPGGPGCSRGLRSHSAARLRSLPIASKHRLVKKRKRYAALPSWNASREVSIWRDGWPAETAMSSRYARILALLETDLDRSTQAGIRRARGMLEGPQPRTLSSEGGSNSRITWPKLSSRFIAYTGPSGAGSLELRRAPGYRRGAAMAVIPQCHRAR